MKHCSSYIGSACIDGHCPRALEDEDGQQHTIKCSKCWYYSGCEDCAAPYYGCCQEGKEEKNNA